MKILARFRKPEPGTIYDRIGGHEAIEVAVDDFYVRVLADDELAGFFAGTNMNRLKGKRSSSSPRRWAARSLTPAHR
ncbi:globin [Mycobacterium intracellulare subsp. yongonense 05-1390]|nr:globin [Mycobacterium intracellulare subsp. yongonense 05-1390]ARR78660.1 globin [Mycobacterium intracellulare subsp. yongonense]ARR83737.1 globin [Mycobacterium intracellulare subsp. yongonense]KEF95476.1 group 1 hemoglobin GlbN [Mycobacterium sp. TKK-01-0059]